MYIAYGLEVAVELLFPAVWAQPENSKNAANMVHKYNFIFVFLVIVSGFQTDLQIRVL